MSVESVHTAPPIEVADGSAAGAAPGKAGRARPAPGHANAPAKPLPDIKADPNRATSPDIDSGIRALHTGDDLESQTRLSEGIDEVVGRLAGEKNLDNYAKVQSATDKILRTYGGLNLKDKAALADAVNRYLRRMLTDAFLQAKNATQLETVTRVAVRYVTAPGPNSMNREHRKNLLVDHMSIAGVDETIVNNVKTQCEAALRPMPERRPR